MTSEDLASLRREYAGRPLLEATVGPDPVAAVRAWLDEAVQAGLPDPNAMTLATVDAEGQPDGRVVLLKGIESGAFVFFTNYASAKGAQLAREPRAALVLFWAELARQIRIRGVTRPVSREASQAYFQSRPRASQLGAWASAQSEVIASRGLLEQRFADLDRAYPEGAPIPTPDRWGGYALVPDAIELWQGRESRLHDRLLARREGGGWRWVRLSP